MSKERIFALHSNVLELCSHPRNLLSNDQIKAIIAKGGMISLTFVPWFMKSNNPQICEVLQNTLHPKSRFLYA
ncbi:MAG: membrane dipeptidase [Paenibacillaceae bacterium]